MDSNHKGGTLRITLLIGRKLPAAPLRTFSTRLAEWARVDKSNVEKADVVVALDPVSAASACRSGSGAIVFVGCLPALKDVRPGTRTMIVRGRQSSRLEHAEAIAAFENIENSRIVELENCGDDPISECPEQLAETLRWFLSRD